MSGYDIGDAGAGDSAQYRAEQRQQELDAFFERLYATPAAELKPAGPELPGAGGGWQEVRQTAAALLKKAGCDEDDPEVQRLRAEYALRLEPWELRGEVGSLLAPIYGAEDALESGVEPDAAWYRQAAARLLAAVDRMWEHLQKAAA